MSAAWLWAVWSVVFTSERLTFPAGHRRYMVGRKWLSVCDPQQKNKRRREGERKMRSKKKQSQDAVTSVDILQKLPRNMRAKLGLKGHSPVRCSEVGVTLHLLKKASVSVSTTSSRASSPPALMAATTCECVFPSTGTSFTWSTEEERKTKNHFRSLKCCRATGSSSNTEPNVFFLQRRAIRFLQIPRRFNVFFTFTLG